MRSCKVSFRSRNGNDSNHASLFVTQCISAGPRENGSRMDDSIRNRINFILFYSIYEKDTKFLTNLVRAITPSTVNHAANQIIK